MLKAKVQLLICFICFGMIGVISSFIPLTSFSIVFYRALFGAVFMILMVLIGKKEYRVKRITKRFLHLVVSGILMGFNWVLFFQSIEWCSVSVATVCYNTAPIFMIIFAIILFKEKMTEKNWICIIMGMIGVILVSNVVIVGIKDREMGGVLFAVLGAMLYALVVIINKKLSDLNSYEKISFEFIVSVFIMLPFIFIGKNSTFTFGQTDNFLLSLVLLIFLGAVITGIIYIIYFDNVDKLPAKTVAIMTYIDPATALILSFLILHEKLNILQVVGVILIILSTIINEFVNNNKKILRWKK